MAARWKPHFRLLQHRGFVGVGAATTARRKQIIHSNMHKSFTPTCSAHSCRESHAILHLKLLHFNPGFLVCKHLVEYDLRPFLNSFSKRLPEFKQRFSKISSFIMGSHCTVLTTARHFWWRDILGIRKQVQNVHCYCCVIYLVAFYERRTRQRLLRIQKTL